MHIVVLCVCVCVCARARAAHVRTEVDTCCLSIHIIGRTVRYEWFVMKFGFGGFTLKLWGEFYFLHIILSLRFFTLSDLSKMVHCPKKKYFICNLSWYGEYSTK